MKKINMKNYMWNDEICDLSWGCLSLVVGRREETERWWREWEGREREKRDRGG